MAPGDETNRLVPEDEGRLVHDRFLENTNKDWVYILEPISDPNTRSKFITLLQTLDNEEI